MRTWMLLTGAFLALASPERSFAQESFSGPYVGVNGGLIVHNTTWTDRDAWVDNFSIDWAIGSASTTRFGGTAGVQAGYNWQNNGKVLGLELDWNWAGLDNSKEYNSIQPAPGTNLLLEDSVNWFATARARAGLAFDDVLFYVTGGVVYADIEHQWTVSDPNILLTPTESFSANEDRWGAVIGVGTEWAVSCNVSVKAEFLYMVFEEVETTGFSANGPGNVHFDNQDWMLLLRVGLNYRF